MERAGDLLSGEHGAYRETTAERFGAGQDIRGDTIVHVGEEIAAAPHSTLHFIKHQQRFVFIAQLTQAL